MPSHMTISRPENSTIIGRGYGIFDEFSLTIFPLEPNLACLSRSSRMRICAFCSHVYVWLFFPSTPYWHIGRSGSGIICKGGKEGLEDTTLRLSSAQFDRWGAICMHLPHLLSLFKFTYISHIANSRQSYFSNINLTTNGH